MPPDVFCRTGSNADCLIFYNLDSSKKISYPLNYSNHNLLCSFSGMFFFHRDYHLMGKIWALLDMIVIWIKTKQLLTYFHEKAEISVLFRVLSLYITLSVIIFLCKCLSVSFLAFFLRSIFLFMVVIISKMMQFLLFFKPLETCLTFTRQKC